MEYIKGYLVLYLVLTIFIQMVPRESFRRYIRLFSEMILVIGLVTPVFHLLGKNEDFLARIEYEAFAEELEQASLDAQKVLFIENDYYVKQYEEALALDVEAAVEQYGYEVLDVTVSLSETYTIEKIELLVEETVDETALKEWVETYYEVEGRAVSVVFTEKS